MTFMRIWTFLCLLPLALIAQEHKSPQEIQQNLDSAEAQLARAEKMFNPYYTGPLLTPSCAMIPPGKIMIQPYVFIADNYASFNKQRESHSLPSNLVSLVLQPIIFQIGVTPTVDVTIQYAGVLNWQNSAFGGGLTDLQTTAGFLIFREKPYIPQFKFTITETYPTGKYKNLSPNGLQLNATGGGAYSTEFGLGFSKVLLWSSQHPLRIRAYGGYVVSTPAHIKNFNSYGGGYHAKGTVHPGHVVKLDFGFEWSFTQRWVLAGDIVYKATNRTKFNGNPGTLASGTPSAVGGGYKDNLSLAPAIEYNWNDHMGFVGGAWFSVYGRSSLNFVQAVLSVYMVLP
ncbi:MAG: hypothetical protein JSS32_02370 [Verrucomicrobia bacterium]|nr:hypothetical protein [Verrucomicrobiota bacterium]